MASQPPATAGMTITTTTDRLWQTVEAILGRALTEAERGSFTTRLAGLRFAPVQPGDLITADLFNALRADVNDLAIRLAALEGAAGGPVLTAIEPAGGEVPVNSLVTLRGLRLGADDRRTAVLFDNVAVVDNQFMNAFHVQSDDQALIFAIPNRFTDLPKLMSVRVRVGTSLSNALSIRVTPEIIRQEGTVEIRQPTAPIGTVVPGRADPHVLDWTVRSMARLPDHWRFSAVVSGVVGASQAAWEAGISIADAGPVRLEPGASRTVRMSVRVPAGAARAFVALRARSDGDTIDRTGSPIEFVAGEAPETSDPRATVRLRAIPPLRDGNPNPLAGSASLLTMRSAAASAIPIELQLASDPPTAGRWRLRTRVDGETARWTLATPVPAGQDDLAPGAVLTASIAITSAASVDTTTESRITIFAEHFPGPAATDPDIRSFLTVPIRGRP